MEELFLTAVVGHRPWTRQAANYYQRRSRSCHCPGPGQSDGATYRRPSAGHHRHGWATAL